MRYTKKSKVNSETTALHTENSEASLNEKMTEFARLNFKLYESLNCVDLEVMNFLYGFPIHFYNINMRLPIPISERLRSYFESSGGNDITNLQRGQTEEREIHTELAKMGIIYSELPKLMNTSKHAGA